MVSLNKLKKTEPSFCVHSKKKFDREVATLCSLDHFHEGGIVFVKNRKFYNKLFDKLASTDSLINMGVIFQESFFKTMDAVENCEFLNKFQFYATVESVDLALSHFSKLFFDEFKKDGNDLVDGRKAGAVRVHPTSVIGENVFLGGGVEIAANVTIHPGCVILSNSKIDRDTVLYPNVVIYRNVCIGQNCIVHANTTIGSDGFSYNFSNGTHLKVWHFGGVLIEDSVEIGSGCSIDQGTFSPTVIGEGSKIDNQVHIAHNCKFGKGVIVCGQVGLAGSVTLGDYVAMGGSANIAPDVKVGNYAQIGGMAGVTGDIPEKAVYGGHPARPLTGWLRSMATLKRISLRQNGKAGRDS